MPTNPNGNRKPNGGTSARAIIARKREAKAIELRLAGLTLDAIAKEIGYADTECARVAILRAMAKIPPPERVEEMRQAEVAKLDEAERQAWEQWQRSTQDAVTETDAETKDGTFKTVRREGQSGNPALLDKIIKCSERRAKLLGLDMPQQLELNHGIQPRVIGLTPLQVFEAAAKRLRENDNASGN